MIERMLLLFDFRNVFILVLLDVSDIETEVDSDIDESENFNVEV